MFFRGRYAFLSNFYNYPIEYNGQYYKTAEHAYQSAKFKDSTIKKYILVGKLLERIKKEYEVFEKL